MKATCRDIKCTFQIEDVCSKFPLSKTCVVTGLEIIPDKPVPKIEKSTEYETFKEFVLQLRKEINADDARQGLCSDNTNFAMGFKIISEVDALVTAITENKIIDVKKELFKLSCSAYKMWRNIN